MSIGRSWTGLGRGGPLGLLYLFVLVAVSYAIGSRLALSLIEASGLQGVFFIPAGITVAFLIRLERKVWWIVLASAGLTEITMDLLSGFSLGQSAWFALANLVEPLVGASIVIAAVGRLNLSRRRHVLWFVVGPVLVGPAVGAALGALSDWVLAGDSFGTTFSQWWLGDALGVVVIGGALLAWGSSPDRRSIVSLGGLGLVALSSFGTLAIFLLTDFPMFFLVLVGIVLAGALIGPRATSLASLSVAATVAVVIAFLEPRSLIVGLTDVDALVVLKLQIGTFALAGMVVAAESHEREIAVARVAEADAEAMRVAIERQRERDLAEQMQRSFLPGKRPHQPGFDIAVSHLAAQKDLVVGGDWYDVIQLAEGRFALVVGDVIGHGVEAMISMGRIRTALGALALHTDDPGSLLREVDGFLSGPDIADYATAFFAVVDPGKGVIRYASAGHPPALLMVGDRSTIWLDQGQSEPLSGSPGTNRRWSEAAFPESATLVLYTDGLIERRGESLSVGMERLSSALIESGKRDSREICDQLIADLTPPTGLTDDVVLVVLKREPSFVDQFRCEYPAEARRLSEMRSDVLSWLELANLPRATVDDVLIAVGETTSNCVRHAFSNDQRGQVRVVVEIRDGSVDAQVTDNGRWEDPNGDGPGLGLSIVEKITTRFEMQPSNAGTTVKFTVPINRGLS